MYTSCFFHDFGQKFWASDLLVISLGHSWTSPHTISKVLLAIYRVLWAKIGIWNSVCGVGSWEMAVFRQIKSDRKVWATGICFLVPPQGPQCILGRFHSLPFPAQNRKKTLMYYTSCFFHDFGQKFYAFELHVVSLGHYWTTLQTNLKVLLAI